MFISSKEHNFEFLLQINQHKFKTMFFNLGSISIILHLMDLTQYQEQESSHAETFKIMSKTNSYDLET